MERVCPFSLYPLQLTFILNIVIGMSIHFATAGGETDVSNAVEMMTRKRMNAMQITE